jgi:hypothetical protein
MQGVLNTNDIKYYSIALLSGSFSLLPFAGCCINKYPLLLKSNEHILTAFYFVFLFLALLLGLLFLEFALWIESKYDEILSAKQESYFLDNEENKFHNANWYAYLLKSSKIHDVIFYIVFRMKFQFAFSFSLFFFVIGLIIINCKQHYITSIELISVIFLTGLLIYSLLKRAWQNCISLSYLRFKYNTHNGELNNTNNNN